MKDYSNTKSRSAFVLPRIFRQDVSRCPPSKKVRLGAGAGSACRNGRMLFVHNAKTGSCLVTENSMVAPQSIKKRHITHNKHIILFYFWGEIVYNMAGNHLWRANKRADILATEFPENYMGIISAGNR